MLLRGLALLCCASLLSCGGSGGGDDDSGEEFRTTFGYFLSTGNSPISGRVFRIMGDSDLSLIQTQTGATQTAGLGFIAGRILDDMDAGVAGVVVQANNDSGVSAAGAIYYQSSTSGAYVPSSVLNVTSTTGRFVAMNVQPGRVNIKCASGADGNLNVRVLGGTTVFAQLNVAATGTQPTWSGVTQNLGGPTTALPGVAEGSVDYEILGTAGLNGDSDAGTGAFSLGTVHARNEFLVRCTKTLPGFVPTHTYVQTVNTNLNSGNGGSVFIVSEANRDAQLVPAGLILTPDTGIIRGVVSDQNGGFTVEARDGNDQVVGVVHYGDNGAAGRPDVTLTATQVDGIFYVYNVPPGQVLLRATKTSTLQAVCKYVDAFANGITLPAPLAPLTQTGLTISVSGALGSLSGFAVPNGTVTLHGLGIADQTDQFGEYTIANAPTQHVLIVRTSK